MNLCTAANIFNLDGAVALVTGGGTGIGLMAAKALAANGAKVYITGRRAHTLENAAKAYNPSLRGSLHAIQADVISKDDLKRVASEIKEGHLHILVNNAGIEGPVTKLGEAAHKLSAKEVSEKHLSNEDYQNWDEVFRINNHSVFYATMALLPLLEAGNSNPPASRQIWSAAVINITSISGLLRLSQNHYAYNSSKAAANSLTVMLAHELNFRSKFNIRVNALAPGLFATEMTVKEVSKNGVSDSSKLAGFINPAGRAGEDHEMASGILFLATNTFVNGQIVALDGGFTTAAPSTH